LRKIEIHLDTIVSLYLTTRGDRVGRRRMLIVGAILMAASGLAFAFTHNFLLLIVAGYDLLPQKILRNVEFLIQELQRST
jgi:hypothetical protein